MQRRAVGGSKWVDNYLAGLPPRFRSALEDLRRTIRAAAPQAVEVISYKMPAFRQDGKLIYYAAFKDHCSLFPGNTATIGRDFAAELKGFATGKGTIQFTPDRPLPRDLVTRIVKSRFSKSPASRLK